MPSIVSRKGGSLNEPQEKAVKSAPERPLLIVAGAGTGKTATLTSRLIRFIKEGVPGGEILSITFTNKAAREMENRVLSILDIKDKLGFRGEGPFIGTFHSFGARILRANARLLGRSAGFIIYDNHDSFALIKKILKGLDRKKESPAAYLAAIEVFKNTGAEPEKESHKEALFRYEAALRSADAFDFDDLLSKTVWLFKNHAEVLARYRRKYTHILIDEYQDLNDIQYELVRLLAGDGASLSVVGDAEQTIYGWRGSNIGNFLRFPDEWPESEMVTLTQNYRSTKNILKAASGVIRENVYETKVERATELWTENPEGEKVTIRESWHEDEEAAWIGEVISRNPDMETAVLYRTNAQSRALEQALLRRRIPYVVFGGLKFYERREIKDIVAALRLALNRNDEIARERLEKAFGKRNARGLEAALIEAGGSPPLATIDLVLRTTDYFAYMEREMSNPRERRENIEELIHFAGTFKELPPLLEEISLLQATDAIAKKEKENAVHLMTIHLGKGLEFDRVFIAGATEGILPHARSMDTLEELQEERRLMYVAMTRARKKLYISFYGVPSRFIGEIPEGAAEFVSARGGRPGGFLDEDYEERYITLD